MTTIRVGGKVVRATSQATTSGTVKNFTSIPSWARRITVVFDQVSLDADVDLLVQIGDSGGLETSGYLSTYGGMQASTFTFTGSSTAGFIAPLGAAARLMSGIYTLVNISGNTWVGSCAGRFASDLSYHGGGTKTLSDTLDRLSILLSGAGNFDAGSVNIMWE